MYSLVFCLQNNSLIIEHVNLGRYPGILSSVVLWTLKDDEDVAATNVHEQYAPITHTSFLTVVLCVRQLSLCRSVVCLAIATHHSSLSVAPERDVPLNEDGLLRRVSGAQCVYLFFRTMSNANTTHTPHRERWAFMCACLSA